MRKYFIARVLGINNAYDVARQLFGNRDVARRGISINLTVTYGGAGEGVNKRC